MNSSSEKTLFGLGVILLVVTSFLAIYTPFIWTFNPPQSKVSKSGISTYIPGVYTQSDPSMPLLQIQTVYGAYGSHYAPNNVMLYNFTLVSHDVPSVPFNSSTHDLVVGFNFSVYFYLFRLVNGHEISFLQAINETFNVNTATTTNNLLFWNSTPKNNLYYTGEVNNTIFVESMLVIETEYESHLNQSIYYGTMVIGGSYINYHFSENKQVVFDSYDYPTLYYNGYFNYITWGNFTDSVIVIGLTCIAIAILLVPFISKKYQKKK